MEQSATWSRSMSKEDLIRNLDAHFFAYIATLDPPLNILACERRIYMGGGPSQQLTTLRELHPLVTGGTWFFQEAFPALTEKKILAIAEAGVLLTLALLIYDHSIDRQLPEQTEILLLHQKLYTAALRRFHTLFEADSSFWNCFDRYHGQYIAALLRETHDHWGKVTEYSLDTMWDIGRGKFALLKAVPVALALKAGEERWIADLEISVESLMAALQLSDDIEDWAEDYQHHRYTLPLTQAIPVDQWPEPKLLEETIGKKLEDTVIIETLLQQVDLWLNQAAEVVVHIPCTQWIAFINKHIDAVQYHRQAFVAQKLLKVISREC